MRKSAYDYWLFLYFNSELTRFSYARNSIGDITCIFRPMSARKALITRFRASITADNMVLPVINKNKQITISFGQSLLYNVDL